MTKQEQYKQAREEHENANELFEFEKYNGWYPTRMLNPDELRELRNAYKDDEKELQAVKLSARHEVIPCGYGYFLKSYNTIVCAIIDGKFYKLWNGYSATTQKHINDFCKRYNKPQLNKKEWVLMDTTAQLISDYTGEIVFDTDDNYYCH